MGKKVFWIRWTEKRPYACSNDVHLFKFLRFKCLEEYIESTGLDVSKNFVGFHFFISRINVIIHLAEESDILIGWVFLIKFAKVASRARYFVINFIHYNMDAEGCLSKMCSHYFWRDFSINVSLNNWCNEAIFFFFFSEGNSSNLGRAAPKQSHASQIPPELTQHC